MFSIIFTEYIPTAFENSYNDIEILQAVGTGITIGNTAEQLKEIADDICGHVSESASIITASTRDASDPEKRDFITEVCVSMRYYLIKY